MAADKHDRPCISCFKNVFIRLLIPQIPLRRDFYCSAEVALIGYALLIMFSGMDDL